MQERYGRLELLPTGIAIVVATALVCATALVIFYFAEIRQPAPLPRDKASCEAAGDVWVPNYANAYGGWGLCQP